MARLAEIWVYPIKSLPAISEVACAILPSGSLQNDRRWAIIDREGRYWNSKRTPQLHQFQLQFQKQFSRLTLIDATGESLYWIAGESPAALESWFSARLESPVRLIENDEAGFPDDIENHGPTIISRESLELISSWFPETTPAEVRRRLRPNLVVCGVEPFWEDRLVRADGRAQPFQIGAVKFAGTNACQRCVVPTRHPETAEVWSGFQKTFTQQRRETFPVWAAPERFSNFYRATTNTLLLSGGGECLKVGESVEILEMS